MNVQKKYNLFIEIIRSLLKSSVTGATPKIAKRTMHILKNQNLTQLSESRYTTVSVALILYIFLIIWMYIHVEAIVLVQKRVFFPVFPHKTRPKLNGSILGEKHLNDH